MTAITTRNQKLSERPAAKDNLLEDKDQYHQPTYEELSQIQANKAFVYNANTFPFMEIFDETDEIDPQCAFLNWQ